MAITPMTENLNIISALPDEPNDVGGLTASQLKAKFDQAGNAIQDYLNHSLIPQLDAVHLPMEASQPDSPTIKETMEGITLGQIPNGSLTEEKLSPQLARTIAGKAEASRVFTREEALSEETAARYGLDRGAVPDQVMDILARQTLPWELIQIYDTPGTYAWVVPDIYGDGLPYEIGAYIIGGGGSGGAVRLVTESAFMIGATGGGSGRTKAITTTVTPGESIPVVVGEGGAAVSLSGQYQYANGNNGGSSAFHGISVGGGEGGRAKIPSSPSLHVSVEGAHGGQGSNAIFAYPWSATEGMAPAMGQSTLSGSNGSNWIRGGDVHPLECFNPFDMKLYLSAGGAVRLQTSPTESQVTWKENTVVLPDGSSSGTAGIGTKGSGNAYATGATGHGNGGCAACFTVWSSVDVGGTVRSGAGAPGAVMIYARKVKA